MRGNFAVHFGRNDTAEKKKQGCCSFNEMGDLS
jgi:hypothetical protein